MKMKETHTYYYDLAVNQGMPPCGDGSIASKVVKEGTVDYIKNLINKYDIKTISDAPCGLYENWMNIVDPVGLGVVYSGFDINDHAIERNRKNYPNIFFHGFNIVTEILPKSDLIICRDCLFHLPNQFVIDALDNFKKSGSTYLLATEQQWVKENKELTPAELENEAGNKPINLQIEPFNMGKPIEFHEENHIDPRGVRTLSLWKIN